MITPSNNNKHIKEEFREIKLSCPRTVFHSNNFEMQIAMQIACGIENTTSRVKRETWLKNSLKKKKLKTVNKYIKKNQIVTTLYKKADLGVKQIL